MALALTSGSEAVASEELSLDKDESSFRIARASSLSSSEIFSLVCFDLRVRAIRGSGSSIGVVVGTSSCVVDRGVLLVLV